MTKTKENEVWAKTLLRRLSVLPFSPTMQEGWEAARDEFLLMLPSIEAGEWLVSSLLKSERNFPPPARMREALSMRYKPDDEKKIEETKAQV